METIKEKIIACELYQLSISISISTLSTSNRFVFSGRQ